MLSAYYYQFRQTTRELKAVFTFSFLPRMQSDQSIPTCQKLTLSSPWLQIVNSHKKKKKKNIADWVSSSGQHPHLKQKYRMKFKIHQFLGFIVNHTCTDWIYHYRILLHILYWYLSYKYVNIFNWHWEEVLNFLKYF